MKPSRFGRLSELFASYEYCMSCGMLRVGSWCGADLLDKPQAEPYTTLRSS